MLLLKSEISALKIKIHIFFWTNSSTRESRKKAQWELLSALELCNLHWILLCREAHVANFCFFPILSEVSYYYHHHHILNVRYDENLAKSSKDLLSKTDCWGSHLQLWKEALHRELSVTKVFARIRARNREDRGILIATFNLCHGCL